jgi:hypothetical protein
MMVKVSYAQKNIKSIQGNSGKRWAVCIGINDYKDKRIVDLKNARGDAKTMGKVLKEYGQFDEVVVMTDDIDPNSPDYPKKTGVLNKLNSLKSSIKPDDLVLFFFSGHGISTGSGESFLVMANSYRENLNGTSVRVKDVAKWFNDMGVKKSLLLVDGSREKFLQTGTSKGVVPEDFGGHKPAAAFYAGGPGGIGYDDTGTNFGAFAGAVIDGIKGHADSKANGGNGDAIVTFAELSSYIKKSVSKWAASSGKKQTPHTSISGDQYGKLALSTYGSLPALAFRPIAGTASTVSAVQLRTQYTTIKGNGAQAMLKAKGFFDKRWNPNRTFTNKYESKTINGDAVVIDNATGLMWHPGGCDKGIEFTQARDWINALNGTGYAGFKDWRMPTLEEAASLLESSKKNGNLYIDPGFKAAQTNTWTGDLSSKDAAWIVFFDQGRVNRDYFYNYFFVRPVRSAK